MLKEESPPVSVEPPSKRVKIEEAFQLSEQQQRLIREDTANKKLWDEAMGNLKEGPVGLTGVFSFLKVRADWLGWGLVGLIDRVVEIAPLK